MFTYKSDDDTNVSSDNIDKGRKCSSSNQRLVV